MEALRRGNLSLKELMVRLYEKLVSLLKGEK